MTPFLVLSIIIIYFGVLITISIITSKGADRDTFFPANRQSPWYLDALGMNGSFSEVTFVSVPERNSKSALNISGYSLLPDEIISSAFTMNLFINPTV